MLFFGGSNRAMSKGQLREKFCKEKESFRIKVMKEFKEEKKRGANAGVGNTENLFPRKQGAFI